MKLFIVARCEKLKNDNYYSFRIEGGLAGKYIKNAYLYSLETNLTIDDEYLLYVYATEIRGFCLYGETLSVKKLDSIKRDYL